MINENKSDEGDEVLPYTFLSLFNFPRFNCISPLNSIVLRYIHFNPDGLKAHNLSQWVQVKPWASAQYIKLIMAQNNTHAQPNIDTIYVVHKKHLTLIGEFR